MQQDPIRGNKSRAVSFRLDDAKERELYQFSFGINLSEFVKRSLAQEYARQKASKSEITVHLGGNE